jgi:hypothetical protein
LVGYSSTSREKNLHDPLLFPSGAQPPRDRLVSRRRSPAVRNRNVYTSGGEQHRSAFPAINPNDKAPATANTEALGKEARLFDSSAILLYLRDKTGKFMSAPKERPELLSVAVLHRV